MLINGWLDWAIIMPGPKSKTYDGTNQAKGIFLHSAEGYKNTLLNLAVNGPLSWHFSNCMDGDFFQHYPITARCWHASAANFSWLGMENEGVGDPRKGRPEPSLNQPQIGNAVRCISDIAAFTGWKPTRPWDVTTVDHTLWEHNEVTRIGGTGSACPSGRIPWQTILTKLEETMPTDNDQILALLALAHFIRNGWNLEDLSAGDKAAIKAAVERLPQ